MLVSVVLLKRSSSVGETREMVRRFVFVFEIVLRIFGSEVGMNFTVELQGFMVVGLLEKVGRESL
jgi:hypothetical protein